MVCEENTVGSIIFVLFDVANAITASQSCTGRQRFWGMESIFRPDKNARSHRMIKQALATSGSSVCLNNIRRKALLVPCYYGLPRVILVRYPI